MGSNISNQEESSPYIAQKWMPVEDGEFLLINSNFYAEEKQNVVVDGTQMATGKIAEVLTEEFRNRLDDGTLLTVSTIAIPAVGAALSFFLNNCKLSEMEKLNRLLSEKINVKFIREAKSRLGKVLDGLQNIWNDFEILQDGHPKRPHVFTCLIEKLRFYEPTFIKKRGENMLFFELEMFLIFSVLYLTVLHIEVNSFEKIYGYHDPNEADNRRALASTIKEHAELLKFHCEMFIWKKFSGIRYEIRDSSSGDIGQIIATYYFYKEKMYGRSVEQIGREHFVYGSPQWKNSILRLTNDYMIIGRDSGVDGTKQGMNPKEALIAAIVFHYYPKLQTIATEFNGVTKKLNFPASQVRLMSKDEFKLPHDCKESDERLRSMGVIVGNDYDEIYQ